MTVAEKITRAKADIDAVYAAGKGAEYDAFWDAFQRNGERTEYLGAFAFFSREAFYPKYDIRMRSASGSAYTFRIFPDSAGVWPPEEEFDMVARLKECGVTLDTSGATNMLQTFYFSCVSTLPILDFSSCTSVLESTFSYCTRLHTLEGIILSDSGTQTFGNTCFEQCQRLESITLRGVLGSSLNLQWSTALSRASIENIISVLSGTASGKVLTLSKTAVNNAFTTAEWSALVATRSNWTISLV